MPKRVMSVIRPCGTLSGLAYDGAYAQETAILSSSRGSVEPFTDSHQVGQRLSRMIHVALHIDDRYICRFGQRAKILVPFAQNQIVPNANAVAHCEARILPVSAGVSP